MPKVDELAERERELLLILAEEQARYEAREGWDFSHTLWSRTCYRMAAARGRVSPTHIPGKHNVEQRFEGVFRRLVGRLIRRGLVRMRPIGSHPQPQQTLGYKGHEARRRDVFLTKGGHAAVTALRAAGLESPGASPPIPEPDGDLGRSTREVPEPDGDVGFPRRGAPSRVAPPESPLASSPRADHQRSQSTQSSQASQTSGGVAQDPLEPTGRRPRTLRPARPAPTTRQMARGEAARPRRGRDRGR